MSEQHGRNKPLHERIKERIKQLADEVVGTLEDMLNPRPAPIPVRVRPYGARPYGARR